MSTTDHYPPLFDQDGTNTVASLNDRRHRRYLVGLLNQRATFAATAVTRASHFLPAAHDHVMWLQAIEQAIEEGWPQLFADSLPDRVREEAALMHTPEQPHPDCGICTAQHTRDTGTTTRLPWAA